LKVKGTHLKTEAVREHDRQTGILGPTSRTASGTPSGVVTT